MSWKVMSNVQKEFVVSDEQIEAQLTSFKNDNAVTMFTCVKVHVDEKQNCGNCGKLMKDGRCKIDGAHMSDSDHCQAWRKQYGQY